MSLPDANSKSQDHQPPSNEVLADLVVARETNRRLNRRCQKLERRINRWQSGQYTINRWRTWLCAWYRAEKARADRLAAENQKLRRPSLWARIWKSANGSDQTREQ